MAQPDEKNNKINSYPKKCNNSLLGKKTTQKEKFSRCFKDNPMINKFNQDSFFIYDQADFFDYFQSLNQKNFIKLTKDEILLLNDNIEFIDLKKSNSKGDKFLNIPEKLIDSLNYLKNIPRPITDIETFIIEKINNCSRRSDITCRSLAQSYQKSTGKNISKSTINNIINKRLGYKYIKTTYKNSFLQSNTGIIFCLCFIKTISRLLKLDYELVFLDESKIELNNDHLRCWRKKNETIYFNNGGNSKLNIIMAIGKDKVYSIKMNKENTSTEIYIDFLKQLNEELKKEQKKKFVIILDNLKVHKTKEAISYCISQKMNLLFNIPYQSVFNTIELCFRVIKRHIYQNLYSSIDEMKNDIECLISKEKFLSSLLYNYKETLQEYLYYEELHRNDNLNSF